MGVLSVKKSFCLILISLVISVSVFCETSYKVEKGDTLYSISRKYGVSVSELRSFNNLSENEVIKIGQTLRIPEKESDKSASKDSSETTQQTSTQTQSETTTYVIEKGDTLYGIAKKYNMKINDLLSLNSLTKDSVIKVGQKIKVTSVKTTAVTKTAETVVAETKKEDDTPAPDTRTYGKTVESDNSTVWPVKNPTVTTVKGKASGVQLSAQNNESVKCIHEGTVMYVGVYRGFGQVAFVQSKTGVIYVYAGLGDVDVKKGDYKVSGDEIGTAGVDSITKKPQITFMVFQNGKPIDPAKAPRS